MHLDALLRAFHLRAEPSQLTRAADAKQEGIDETRPLLWGSGAAQGPLHVLGRYYHAVQVAGLDGTDVFAIEGTLDGTTWVAITGLTALNANGLTQFIGVFRHIRAARTSGTGTATQVSLLSMRP